MPEHLKALIAILVLSLSAFAIEHLALQPAIRPDLARRRNAWAAITVLAFISGNFWYYVIGTALIVLVTAGRERNKVALYFALLFAIPPFSEPIPGFGLVQQVFPINHPRLLSLFVLLPAFLSLISQPDRVRFGRLTVDKFVLAYLAVQAGFTIAFTSFTGIQRGLSLLFLDVFLPYYVISRGAGNSKAIRESLIALVFAVIVTAPIAVFELFRHWILYSNLDEALGLAPWAFGSYLGRGEGIRAVVTSGHPIAFGYSVAVALALYGYVSHFVTSKSLRNLGWVGLGAALVASISRGPWVGAAAGLTVVYFLGKRDFGKRVLVALCVGAALSGVLAITPLGPIVVDYLPFVGSVDEGSVSYRKRVFEVSLQVILQYPVLGAYAYRGGALEELRQGEGIIDIVNTYVGVALANGFVGLFAFIGVPVSALWRVWRGWRAHGDANPEVDSLGRSLFGAVIAILVTLATTSTVGLIGQIFWALAGLCAAFELMCFFVGTDGQLKTDKSRQQFSRLSVRAM